MRQGTGCYCVQPKNTAGAKKKKKSREEAASSKVMEIKKNESVERSNSFPWRERDGNTELWQQQWQRGLWVMMEQGNIGMKGKEDKKQVWGRQDERKTDH